MSLDFGSLVGAASGLFTPIQWQLRAQVEWARINDKATDIELMRQGVLLAPQTVRIEQDGRLPMNDEDDAGISSLSRITLFGVRGHPEIDDLDVEIWDTFVFEAREYTVLTVNKLLIGQVQVYCEATG